MGYVLYLLGIGRAVRWGDTVLGGFVVHCNGSLFYFVPLFSNQRFIIPG